MTWGSDERARHRPDNTAKNADSDLPEDSDPGEEFEPAIPRPVPRSIRRGRYAMSRMATAWTLLMIGAACCLTHPLPFVVQLSWYLLPLGYLDWVGWVLLGFGGLVLARNLLTLGRMTYVRDGVPIAGHVTNVLIHYQGTAEAPQGRFAADVDYVHPETGERITQRVLSPDVYHRHHIESLSPGVSIGDRVVLVALPGRISQSLSLYGWTGLSPDCDLIEKNGVPLKPTSPLKAILVVLGVMAMFWMLLGFLYVIGRYTPVDDQDPTQYLIGVGIVAVLGMIPAVIAGLRGAPIRQALGSAFFGGILGAVAGFVVIVFLNGALDDSPPQLQPIEVVQLWHETINFVVRTYQIEYRDYPNGAPRKAHVSVERLSEFAVGSLGVIDVARGRLGLRWVRDFHPIQWIPANPGDPPSPDQIVFQIANEPARTIVPRIELPDGIHPPPEILFPSLKDSMERLLKSELNATILKQN